MNNMNRVTRVKRWIAVAMSSVILMMFVLVPPSAEARVGGGRSSGFRGSRGFTSQPYRYTQPQRSYRAPQPAQPYTPQQAAPQRGSFLRSMAGGLAGGFLGSMLFNRLGYGGGATMGMPGVPGSGGGVGLFEILLVAGLAYAAYWFFKKRKQEVPQYYERANAEAVSSSASEWNEPQAQHSERDVAEVLQRVEPHFVLNGFKEQRMDDFLKIQSAWNSRDLSSVGDLLAPEMKSSLEADVNRMRSLRQINKLENIAVRETELLEAWEESGRTYATLKIRAQLLDYTVDESSQALIAGDRNQPVKFQEEWTFVRGADYGSSYGSVPWKLTAISQMEH